MSEAKRGGLAGAIGTNVFGQVVQLFIQIAGVPVFIYFWGLETYGIWLVLFTIPAYLAISDLGITGAATNAMTMAVARENREEALAIYQALRLVLIVGGVAIMGIAYLFLFVAFPNLLDFAQGVAGGQARVALLILIAYGLVALQNTTTFGAFRAVGGYAVGAFAIQLTLLIEALLAFGAVAIGFGIVQAAAVYLIARSVGAAIMAGRLKTYAPWITAWRVQALPGPLRPLAQPAMAMIALPGANAVVLQGMVLAIGAQLGAAAVPVFTVVRTVTRVPLQAVLVVNLATMPNISAAHARGDMGEKARLAALSVGAAVLVLVPAAIGIALLGPEVIALWTGGAVDPPPALLFTMIAAMVFAGFWTPASNLLLAINEHMRYTYFYLVAAVAAVAIAFALLPRIGLVGAGVALAAMDAVMLAWVLSRLRLARVIDFHQMRAHLREFRARGLLRHIIDRGPRD